MSHYFAIEAVIPLRSDPAESAEMVSQLLFGDIAILIEDQGNWWKVRNQDDGYEGWLNPRMIHPIPQEQLSAFTEWHYLQSPQAFIEAPEGTQALPMGARIPIPAADGHFLVGDLNYRIPWQIQPGLNSPDEIPQLAQTLLYTPYLWGGRSSYGIDCSGLVQSVFRMCGISLPRDSSQQFKEGQPISAEARKAGDLVFFSKPNKESVSHVGIVIEDGRVIHASGRVRIDPLLAEGLFAGGQKNLSHRLIGLKRIDV